MVLVEVQWCSRTISWESEKFKKLASTISSVRDHIAIDGSLKGILGRHGACGWSVQLDHGGELEPMHVFLGPLMQELMCKRTISRADMTAFWVALRETDNICILSVVEKRICREPKQQIYGSKCGKKCEAPR